MGLAGCLARLVRAAGGSGWTKASLYDAEAKYGFFCFHFAKGRCSKGKDCTFFHLIPDEDDARRVDASYDCFGRQRHNSHREDR